MDQVIKIYEYQIKTKFNPVKFNNQHWQMPGPKTSKVMFKNKKTVITVVVILLLIIATIIFIVVKNKKKRKKLEEEASNNQAQTPPSRQVVKTKSSVIPPQDQPGAEKPAPAPKPEATVPLEQGNAPVNNAVPMAPPLTRPQPANNVVNPKAQPQVEEKKITPLADKGINIENELNKPIDQD